MTLNSKISGIICAAAVLCTIGCFNTVYAETKAPAGKGDEAEAAKLPKDVPPVMAMATAEMRKAKDGNGTYTVTLVAPRIRYEVVSRVERRGKTAMWEDVQVKVKPWTRVLRFETMSQIPDTRIVGVDGKPVSKDEVLRRLKRSSPVLISASGKMVDAYYLQLVKKDTLIFLLSRKDGMGDRALLASEWPAK